MYLYVIFLCQLLSLTGASESGIIGGEKAKPHSRPYMVSVQAKGGHHVCGGMLIREDFVLTSAHCLEHGPVMVALGANNIKTKEKCQQKIRVAHYHRHPKHLNITDLRYDIMLLKLNTAAKLNKNVEAIELAKKDERIKSETVCSVAGWGLTENQHKLRENVLNNVTVKMEDNKKCKTLWQQHFDEDQMMCTRSNRQKGFCQGDSGGPLVCNKKAYGVVAYFANGDHNIQYPNVYMKIPFFMPWITEVLHGYGANLSNTV